MGHILVKLTLNSLQEFVKAWPREGLCLSKKLSPGEPALFQCKKGHQWKMPADDVVSRMAWCPQCKKTEGSILSLVLAGESSEHPATTRPAAKTKSSSAAKRTLRPKVAPAKQEPKTEQPVATKPSIVETLEALEGNDNGRTKNGSDRKNVGPATTKSYTSKKEILKAERLARIEENKKARLAKRAAIKSAAKEQAILLKKAKNPEQKEAILSRIKAKKTAAIQAVNQTLKSKLKSLKRKTLAEIAAQQPPRFNR